MCAMHLPQNRVEHLVAYMHDTAAVAGPALRPTILAFISQPAFSCLSTAQPYLSALTTNTPTPFILINSKV